MAFPFTRLRRLRYNGVLREMVAETKLERESFVMPYFLREGKNVDIPVSSMPGVSQLSIDKALKKIDGLIKTGVKSVLLFGIPSRKDELGTQSYSPNGIIQKAVKTIKDKFPGILVITDICMCEYTSHGHCGILKKRKRGEFLVDNDATLKALSKIALSHANAGADLLAPSDMMDGRIKAIRETLDGNGFHELPIMSYSAKYASSFYSPFREAAESAPAFGDRKTYQMNFANSDEAVREVALDVEEGADIVMVKPALSYLDIIYRVKHEFRMPVCAYNVSGEYSIIKSASNAGIIDEKKTALEILVSIKRAGADIIISYWSEKISEWLK